MQSIILKNIWAVEIPRDPSMCDNCATVFAHNARPPDCDTPPTFVGTVALDRSRGDAGDAALDRIKGGGGAVALDRIRANARACSVA